MSWYSPNSQAETIGSTRAGFGWRMGRWGLEASQTLVLSYTGMTGVLDSSHPLTDHVLTGAERYRDDYMAGGPNARKPHPSVTVYYIRDLNSRRVVLAYQADGTVLDELDAIRPDLKEDIRAALREVFPIGGARVAGHREGGL